jgi:hypothetical protein
MKPEFPYLFSGEETGGPVSELQRANNTRSVPAWPPPTAVALHHNRFQPSEHGGADAGGTSAVDAHVVFRARGIAELAQFLRDLSHGRAFHARAVGENTNGNLLVVKRINLR